MTYQTELFLYFLLIQDAFFGKSERKKKESLIKICSYLSQTVKEKKKSLHLHIKNKLKIF